MNWRERLQLRATINFIIDTIERLVALFAKYSKSKTDNNIDKVEPKRKRLIDRLSPLKRK